MGQKILSWVGLGGAEAKMRANAENWLELADKVWQYRRDQLSEAERAELMARIEALRENHRREPKPGS